jgi:hypothetical protein
MLIGRVRTLDAGMVFCYGTTRHMPVAQGDAQRVATAVVPLAVVCLQG